MKMRKFDENKGDWELFCGAEETTEYPAMVGEGSCITVVVDALSIQAIDNDSLECVTLQVSSYRSRLAIAKRMDEDETLIGLVEDGWDRV